MIRCQRCFEKWLVPDGGSGHGESSSVDSFAHYADDSLSSGYYHQVDKRFVDNGFVVSVPKHVSNRSWENGAEIGVWCSEETIAVG